MLLKPQLDPLRLRVLAARVGGLQLFTLRPEKQKLIRLCVYRETGAVSRASFISFYRLFLVWYEPRCVDLIATVVTKSLAQRPGIHTPQDHYFVNRIASCSFDRRRTTQRLVPCVLTGAARHPLSRQFFCMFVRRFSPLQTAAAAGIEYLLQTAYGQTAGVSNILPSALCMCHWYLSRDNLSHSCEDISPISALWVSGATVHVYMQCVNNLSVEFLL